MARNFAVPTGEQGGYVIVEAVKDSSTLSDYFCKIVVDARNGIKDATFPDLKIGGFHGRSGNYTASPYGSVTHWVDGLETLQDAVNFLVEFWVIGEGAAAQDAALAAALAEATATYPGMVSPFLEENRPAWKLADHATELANNVSPGSLEPHRQAIQDWMTYAEKCAAMNLQPGWDIAAAHCQACLDHLDAQEAKWSQDMAPRSTGWVTSAHAHHAFHALAAAFDPFENNTLAAMFQAQAAFHCLKAAEPDELLALPETAGASRWWCPNCGAPSTETRVAQLLDGDTVAFQRTLWGGAVLRVNGRIGRYCPACAPLMKFLALPMGDEPTVERDHLVEMAVRFAHEQTQAVNNLEALGRYSADTNHEETMRQLRAMGDALRAGNAILARYNALIEWPRLSHHRGWDGPLLERVEIVARGDMPDLFDQAPRFPIGNLTITID